MDKYPITKKGLFTVTKAIDKINKLDKIEVIKSIAIARAHGDLKENAEYHAAKDQLSLLESQLSELKTIINTAEIVDISSNDDYQILFGATIELEELNEGRVYRYKILSPFEANITNGIIGINSPLARASLGKELDDIIEFLTPAKQKSFIVISIKYV
jgi:transcription elongation factor GreA